MNMPYHFQLVRLLFTLAVIVTTQRSTSPVSIFADAAALKGNKRNIDGYSRFLKANELFEDKKYDDAAVAYWEAFTAKDAEQGKEFNKAQAYQQFVVCHMKQQRLADGLGQVAQHYFEQGQYSLGRDMYHQVSMIDAKNRKLKTIQDKYGKIIKSNIPDKFKEEAETALPEILSEPLPEMNNMNF